MLPVTNDNAFSDAGYTVAASSADGWPKHMVLGNRPVPDPLVNDRRRHGVAHAELPLQARPRSLFAR